MIDWNNNGIIDDFDILMTLAILDDMETQDRAAEEESALDIDSEIDSEIDWDIDSDIDWDIDSDIDSEIDSDMSDMDCDTSIGEYYNDDLS